MAHSRRHPLLEKHRRPRRERRLNARARSQHSCTLGARRLRTGWHHADLAATLQGFAVHMNACPALAPPALSHLFHELPYCPITALVRLLCSPTERTIGTGLRRRTPVPAGPGTPGVPAPREAEVPRPFTYHSSTTSPARGSMKACCGQNAMFFREASVPTAILDSTARHYDSEFTFQNEQTTQSPAGVCPLEQLPDLVHLRNPVRSHLPCALAAPSAASVPDATDQRENGR